MRPPWWRLTLAHQPYLGYCNPDGNPAHSGSGVVVGKNWTLSATVLPTIVSGGSGYNVGDVITFPNPSKAPYYGFKLAVTSVSGGVVTGLSITAGTNQGAYALPPAFAGDPMGTLRLPGGLWPERLLQQHADAVRTGEHHRHRHRARRRHH